MLVIQFVAFVFATISLYGVNTQKAVCSRSQWQCRDGGCVELHLKCDGIADCKDASDETHPVCRLMACQRNQFRCAYGACANSHAACNGIVQCADLSDELHPACRGDSEMKGLFKCVGGIFIPASELCDGTPNCPDGSDETVRACAAQTCPQHLFQCAYGACVDQGAQCNKIQDCADNSDESEGLCGKNDTAKVRPKEKCILPPYPSNGYYQSNIEDGAPGNAVDHVLVRYTCMRGYTMLGTDSVYCVEGVWSASLPECIHMCKLPKHPSVEYRCMGIGATEEFRECNDYVSHGTVVNPQCNTPMYHAPTPLPLMHCVNGDWDEIVTCKPECGKAFTSNDLIPNVRPDLESEVPWHATVYAKGTNDYRRLCGGTLISESIVISAAHCVSDYSGAVKPSSDYTVAFGQVAGPWDAIADKFKFNVKRMYVPAQYRSASANYQNDIAVIQLAKQVQYSINISPICIDFDVKFESIQLQDGNLGKMAVQWPYLKATNASRSLSVKVISLPYLEVGRCINNVPASVMAYITADKICAGSMNGDSLVCNGDSGGGLVFPAQDGGRYYLRGIASTSLTGASDKCSSFVGFTSISKHEVFIKKHLYSSNYLEL